MTPHYLKVFLSLSTFLFMIIGCNASFTYCQTNPCKPILLALSEVLNSFENLTNIEIMMSGIDYCRTWAFILCDFKENIITINLNNAHLRGTISPFFSNFTFLEHLLLRENNLTGEVPESLTDLSMLQDLDISVNNLTGRMPTFDKRVEINTAGNLFLEINLPGNEGQAVESRTRGSISNKVIVLIVIGIISLVGATLFLVFFKHYRRAEGVVRSDFNDQSIHLHMISRGGNSFSIEVLRGATNNFAEDKIIGRGGCGLVYKGDLPDDSEIAIKKMDFRVMEARGLNEYQAEIDVLTRVRHRHLVALLGYCIDGHERFLVYEYMRQGTLSQHLFGLQQHGYSPLTWKQRIIIALDVGRGIEYLHSSMQQSFIHRDLKPSNILLDDNLRAKVADFGLVKNAPEGQSSVETQLAGTFGYLAPEYAETGRVTTKVDIYAFGVILMELITGRKAIDNSLGEERCHLVTWFRQVMNNEENIQNEIDRTLNLDEETMSSITKVAELAVHCTAQQRHHRPDMGYVVNMLSPLVEQQWRPTASPNEDEEETEGINLHMSLPQILEQWQEEGTRTSTMYYDLDE